MSVFKTQTGWSVVAETEESNLAAATEKLILYKKPNRAKGEWIATVSGTTLVYNVVDGDLDIAGTWRFQAFYVLDGKRYFGKVASKIIEAPLKIPE
jgi:hypothetical protein